jgi:hypothetical protein
MQPDTSINREVYRRIHNILRLMSDMEGARFTSGSLHTSNRANYGKEVSVSDYLESIVLPQGQHECAICLEPNGHTLMFRRSSLEFTDDDMNHLLKAGYHLANKMYISEMCATCCGRIWDSETSILEEPFTRTVMNGYIPIVNLSDYKDRKVVRNLLTVILFGRDNGSTDSMQILIGILMNALRTEYIYTDRTRLDQCNMMLQSIVYNKRGPKRLGESTPEKVPFLEAAVASLEPDYAKSMFYMCELNMLLKLTSTYPGGMCDNGATTLRYHLLYQVLNSFSEVYKRPSTGPTEAFNLGTTLLYSRTRSSRLVVPVDGTARLISLDILVEYGLLTTTYVSELDDILQDRSLSRNDVINESQLTWFVYSMVRFIRKTQKTENAWETLFYKLYEDIKMHILTGLKVKDDILEVLNRRLRVGGNIEHRAVPFVTQFGPSLLVCHHCKQVFTSGDRNYEIRSLSEDSTAHRHRHHNREYGSIIPSGHWAIDPPQGRQERSSHTNLHNAVRQADLRIYPTGPRCGNTRSFDELVEETTNIILSRGVGGVFDPYFEDDINLVVRSYIDVIGTDLPINIDYFSNNDNQLLAELQLLGLPTSGSIRISKDYVLERYGLK